MNTMALRDKVSEALQEALGKNPKHTLYFFAKEGKTNYSNLKEAVEGTRGFSDEMIKALGNNPLFPYSYFELRLMKAKDEYPELAPILEKIERGNPDVFKEAAEIVMKEWKEKGKG